MAIEIHGRITASGVRVFIRIHKYIAGSQLQPIRRLNNLNRFFYDADFFYYSFKNVCISDKKNPIRLVYSVISWVRFGGSIAWNALGTFR